MKDLPKDITIGDKYGPAMKVQTEKEAAEYLEICIKHMMLRGHTREKATAIELGNIGYYAGYYNSETRERVYRLFKAQHPVFGRSTPTSEEASTVGAKDGRYYRKVEVTHD